MNYYYWERADYLGGDRLDIFSMSDVFGFVILSLKYFCPIISSVDYLPFRIQD